MLRSGLHFVPETDLPKEVDMQVAHPLSRHAAEASVVDLALAEGE
jgi:hypothetical protein